MATLFVLIAGACVGSFLGAAAYRMPRGLSVVRPRSRCTACGRRLTWPDLVPVASYVVRRGRCSSCGTRISASYPLLETATALCFGALYELFGPTPAALRHAVLACLLLTATAIDARHGIIPDRLVGAGLVLGMLLTGLPGGGALPEVAAAAATAGGTLLAVRALGRRLFGRAGMGLGDVKLAVMSALFLGWATLWVFYVAAVLGGAYGLAGIATGRFTRTTPVPFAPFVAVAAVLHLSVLPASLVFTP